MKIYRNKSGYFWFYQNDENGWFCFYCQLPKINTLILGPGGFGYEEELEAVSHGARTIRDADEKFFNQIAQMENNYNDVCEFIKGYYPECEQDELDKQFQHYPDILKFTYYIVANSGRDIHLSEFRLGELYRLVKSHMDMWDGDKARVKKYVVEHDLDKILIHDSTMVDVWDCQNVTKRFLLREFYGYWGMFNLEEHIEESIELYPVEKDYDKAFYYVRDKLNEEIEKHREHIRKKQN